MHRWCAGGGHAQQPTAGMQGVILEQLLRLLWRALLWSCRYPQPHLIAMSLAALWVQITLSSMRAASFEVEHTQPEPVPKSLHSCASLSRVDIIIYSSGYMTVEAQAAIACTAPPEMPTASSDCCCIAMVHMSLPACQSASLPFAQWSASCQTQQALLPVANTGCTAEESGREGQEATWAIAALLLRLSNCHPGLTVALLQCYRDVMYFDLEGAVTAVGQA